MNLFAQLDEWAVGFLDAALEPFTHYSFGLVAALVLVLLALVSLLILWLRANRVASAINDANWVLAECQGEADFVEKYSSIDASLRANPALGGLWEEFVDTLIPPLKEVDDPAYRVYRNTVRPQTFFTDEYLLKDVRPWIRSEMYVGVGLLLTFLGLVAALSESGSAFAVGGEPGETAVIKAALANLLAIAGTKFMASVGGLSASILQNLLEGRLYRSPEQQLRFFNEALEARLSYASVERIAADQYGHAQRQTQRLEEMSRDIAKIVGDRIDGAVDRIPGMMGDSLGQAMQPVTGAVGRLGNDLLQSNRTLLEEMNPGLETRGDDSNRLVVEKLDSLNDSLSELARSLSDSRDGISQVVDQLHTASNATPASIDQRLSTLMEQMVDQQAKLGDGLEALVQRLESASRNVGDDINHSLENMVERTGGVVEQAATETASRVSQRTEAVFTDFNSALHESFQRISEHLEQWAQHSAEVSQSLREIDTGLSDSRRELATSSESIVRSTSAFAQAGDMVRSATGPLNDASQLIVESLESMRLTNQGMAEQLNAFSAEVKTGISETRDMIEALNSQWNRQSSQLEDADKVLEEAFRQVANGMADSLQQLSRFTDETSDKLAQALDALGGMVSELSDAVSDSRRQG